MKWIVTTAPGLEELLKAELVSLDLEVQPSGTGALTFEGSWPEAARVLTRSRIASRLLLSIRAFSAKNSAMLYDQVRRIKWTDWLPPGLTLAVGVHGSVEGTDYAMSFAPLKIKDAICDEMKKLGVERPNIDRKDADVKVEALIHDGRCELSIDVSKGAIHRRGYRSQGGEAPLRENRAAALLIFSGYDGSQPFVDPFCGSGTLAIEAALIATNTAPGLLRDTESYSELWKRIPEAHEALLAARAAATRDKKPATQPILASDIRGKTLDEARVHARRAGVGELVKFSKADACQLEKPGYWIVTNPPYGVRLEEQEDAEALLSDFTRQVKHACTGSTLALVVEAGPLEKCVGFKPSKKLTVQNGPLTTKFLKFEIFAGKRKS